MTTRLIHAPSEVAARERFAESAARVMQLVPEAMRAEVEQKIRSGTEMAFLLHGLEFARVRMGVQPEHPIADLAEYVLRPMRKAELEIAAEMTEQAAEAVEMILTLGTPQAMNRFNRRVAAPEDPEA